MVVKVRVNEHLLSGDGGKVNFTVRRTHGKCGVDGGTAGGIGGR